MLDRLKLMQASGRLDTAEATFARMARDTPGHLHAWLGLGYCASLKGDAVAARQAFEAAAALAPGQEDAVIDCARAFSHLGAAERGRAMLGAAPRTARQQMALGEIEERHGALAAALACYQAAAALEPGADHPLRKVIELHRRAGAFQAALAAADILAALDPRHEAAAWHQRGLVLRAANDREGAAQAFRRAAEQAPKIEHYVLDWSRELQAAGRTEEAEALLAARPPSYGLLLDRGEIALGRRDHDAALRSFAAAHALEPERPDPLARSARAEADRGDFDAAHAFADRIEALGPAHRLAARRIRLTLCRAAGDEAAALSTLRQMAEAMPGDVGIMAELARQYRATGERDRAQRIVEDALARDPLNPAALAAAVDQAVAEGEHDTALDLCRRLLAAASEQAGHHLRLARLLRDGERGAEAEAVMAEAAARFGPSAEIRGERIRILRDGGQSYAALREARLAQAAFPVHFGLWAERFRLELRLSPIAEVEGCLACAPVRSRDDEAEGLLARAQMARRRHDLAGAIAHLEAALRLKSHHRGILGELVDLYLRTLDLDRARACLRRKAVLETSERRAQGLTPNASQSPQGQLLNDYLIDRKAVAELARARALEPAEEVEAVLSLVRHRPNHIPTAFGLIGALQRAGLIARPRHAERPAGRRAIPDIIVQFWDAPQLSAELLQFSASWRDHNPGHRYYLFNADTAWNYLRRYFPRPVLTAYARCGDPTTQSDIFRLAFLLRHGGIWADMDDRCLETFPGLIAPDADACFWVETGSICNNFMAAAPGHPILRLALIMAVEAINRGDRDKVWLLTGPGLVSRAFALYLAERPEAWRERLGRIALLDEFELTRFVAVHCQTTYKRMGRNWTRTAFAAGEAARKAA